MQVLAAFKVMRLDKFPGILLHCIYKSRQSQSFVYLADIPMTFPDIEGLISFERTWFLSNAVLWTPQRAPRPNFFPMTESSWNCCGHDEQLTPASFDTPAMAANSIKLLTGNSHPELAKLVADR